MKSSPFRPLVALTILASCCAVGCEYSEPPKFRLNMVAMTSNELDEQYQQEIADALGGVFGTPDQPQVLAETGLQQSRLSLAAGPAWSDSEGVERGLYRKHCVHCHGVSGDGRGPTGRFLTPYPRDYRAGVYKFKSTYGGSKPSDADLHRVLVNGVQGTSMPSFALLPSAEIEALVEYVKYLTMRGELETKLAGFVYNELGMEEVEDEDGNEVLDENGEPEMRRLPFNPAEDQEQREVVMELLAEVVEEWEAAAEQVIAPVEEEIPADNRSPEEIAESIAVGRELFYDAKKGNCMQCHGPTALGDGNLANLDVWNETVKTFVSDTDRLAESIADQAAGELSDEDRVRLEQRRVALASREEVAATLYPVRAIHPRNLRSGIYRGGRRRIDIFHRVHAGINGSGMPGVGGASAGAQGTLSEEEIWHIVDYVLSLPYEPISGPQRALPVNAEAVVN